MTDTASRRSKRFSNFLAIAAYLTLPVLTLSLLPALGMLALVIAAAIGFPLACLSDYLSKQADRCAACGNASSPDDDYPQ